MINILRTKKKYVIGAGALFLVACIIIGISVSLAPSNFPSGTIIHIEKNSSLSQIATLLEQKGVVKSAFIYKVYVRLMHDGKGVRAGEYAFDAPQSALRVAYRTSYGIQGLDQIKVTIPEGLASYDIARLLAKSIPGFDSKAFLAIAKPQEGYLFPDTYFFYQDVSPEQVLETMRSNFDDRTRDLSMSAFIRGKSFKDILTLASIVQKEATSTVERRIIAGILWKRLSINMPLQVDPPFFYILGKTSLQLTLTDLATSSPYNLYKHTGLPPTPIDSPGVDAIAATMNPTESKYLFYLSDTNGVMHFSSTYEGHLTNRDNYIK